ncbi:nickel-dependent hydrogenase large subunit [Azospirillum sp. TSO35-2]|uniref:nickel-dependent hydrogenase large subunit n=1 Tax=Azospirillum sp. TSO35-2 TaxID=716796 RepID=UPI000D65E2AC|nr:nickel-dependent hydrogenase large subunit [Azospirillum sp. TSO35-2]
MSGHSLPPARLATAPLPTEGSVTVRLAVADGAIRRATVASRRPRAVAALVGRTPDEAVRLAPLLFSLCGTAQGLAVARACEAALGLDAGAHETARALLTDAEALESHGWQAVVEWPARLGQSPRPADLRDLRAATAAVAAALYPGKDALRLGGGALRPDAAALREALARMTGWLEQRVFAGSAPQDADALAAWAARGGCDAARLAARLLEPALAGWGACGVPALAERSPDWFAAALAADPGFAARPRCHGAPAHTGPLERQAGHPLVRSVTERHGDGLARLFAARLADLAELPRRMAAAVAALDAADPVEQRSAHGPGSGGGVAETARGRLAHWVRLDGDGRLADARMVAPTDWNFAADGPLACGLGDMPTGGGDGDAVERARLLVAMLDPCVACTITVDDADTLENTTDDARDGGRMTGDATRDEREVE